MEHIFPAVALSRRNCRPCSFVLAAYPLLSCRPLYSPFNEDSDGQRILYASSQDGRQWSAATVLFPGLPARLYNTSMRKVQLQPAPFVTLNGRLYVATATATFAWGATRCYCLDASIGEAGGFHTFHQLLPSFH